MASQHDTENNHLPSLTRYPDLYQPMTSSTCVVPLKRNKWRTEKR